MSDYPTIPLPDYIEYPIDEMRERLRDFFEEMSRRRTVREFSDRPVPRDAIEKALEAACSPGILPSSAGRKPRRKFA